jgi:hypothetical protein
MISLRKTQQGFGFLPLFLVAAVIVGAGVISYRLVANNDAGVVTSQNATAAVPKVIKTKADVTSATKLLDDTSIADSVNPDQLDADISALL